MPHICIIGAGVIGLTTAWRLAEDGHQVTLLDGGEQAASGASHANGGQLSYHYIAPLADAGMPLKALGWLLQSDAPMRWQPAADLAQWRWLWRFLLACNTATHQRNLLKLWQLAMHSRLHMRDFAALPHADYARQCNGKLVVFRSAAGFAAARRGMTALARLGAEQQALDGAACLALEPALAGMAHSLAGGIFTAAEEVADCLQFCQQLEARLLTLPNVRLQYRTQAAGFGQHQGRIDSVQLDHGDAIACDHVVIAAGCHSPALARLLGDRLNLYPLKGYSLDMPAGAQPPTVSITDADHKILYAPINGRLRVAALADLTGMDDSLDPQRLQSLMRRIAADMPMAGKLPHARPWAGLRPATPDGLPLIGKGRHDNAWYNTGHGALGFTLAAGSADLLARRIAGEQEPASLRGLFQPG